MVYPQQTIHLLRCILIAAVLVMHQNVVGFLDLFRLLFQLAVNPAVNLPVIIVKLADWNTTTSNIFAKTAIRFVQGLPKARLLKFVVVSFWKGWT